jgi:hypothetical protein
MDSYAKLIEYGQQNQGRPRKNKNNTYSVNKLAEYFNKLANAMRYFLEHGRKHPSSKTITDEMNLKLSEVFGPSWYSKEYNTWTEENQLAWLTSFKNTKHLQADDWYKITVEDFIKNGGSGLIDKYDNCVKKILDKFGLILYPNHEFYDWKFERVYNWEVPYKPEYPTYDAQNTSKYELFKSKILSGSVVSKEEIPLFRRFIDYVIVQEKLSDIYQLRDGIIRKHGGAGLIAGYGFREIVELAYPEIKLQLFRMPHIQLTEQYWTPDNMKQAFEYYRKIKNIPVSDLIKVSKVDIENQGWWSLSYKGTMLTLLQTAYPEIEWDPLGVSKIPWTKENRIEALNRLAKKEGWKECADYYKFTIELAEQNNLIGLLNCYNNSPIQLLRDLRPDYKWREWKFSKSNRCWSDGTTIKIDMIRSYFDEFYEENDFKSLDDFAGYIVKDFPQGILVFFNFNLYKCMTAVYPEHSWEEDKFQAVNYSKTSIRLWKYLMSIIPMLSLQHKLNGGEVMVGKYPVDAYHRADTYDDVLYILSLLPSYCMVKKHENATCIIFQYHGTYWHAHPDYYEASYIHPTRKIECGLIYTETCRITEELSKTHHVVEIWEHEYLKST